jgi:hypothetical protein
VGCAGERSNMSDRMGASRPTAGRFASRRARDHAAPAFTPSGSPGGPACDEPTPLDQVALPSHRRRLRGFDEANRAVLFPLDEGSQSPLGQAQALGDRHPDLATVYANFRPPGWTRREPPSTQSIAKNVEKEPIFPDEFGALGV